MSVFNERDYERLATLFRCGEDWKPYPGYRPKVVEAPNGDGNIDAGKRYLHVALKYNPPKWELNYLARAHFEACRVAELLGVKAPYYPRVADATLRVIDYPAGSGSAEHKDFDLFTILLWRSHPEDLQRTPTPGLTSVYCTQHEEAERLNPGLHIGELGELVGLGPATPHRVPARPYPQQSIVYFAMPDHSARLPAFAEDVETGAEFSPTVGEWLKERLDRSRYEV